VDPGSTRRSHTIAWWCLYEDDQLMSQRDKLEFQRRSAAKPEREHGDGADRMVIMPPDRTPITQENPQAFLIVHRFELFD
jgi:hypothetical protein